MPVSALKTTFWKPRAFRSSSRASAFIPATLAGIIAVAGAAAVVGIAAAGVTIGAGAGVDVTVAVAVTVAVTVSVTVGAAAGVPAQPASAKHVNATTKTDFFKIPHFDSDGLYPSPPFRSRFTSTSESVGFNECRNHLLQGNF